MEEARQHPTMISELGQIKRILWEDWDPIGVNGSGPDDEYDSYAFQVVVMLKQGKNAAEIAEYLRWAETENMGLDDSHRHSKIAQKVVQLREANQ